jgi:putative flippase GtrA
LKTLLAAEGLVFKGVRFGFVGALSSLLFAAVTAALISWIRIDPKLASVAGYFVSMPLNFAGNRRFAFKSENALPDDLRRFVLLHICGILITVFATGAAVDIFRLHYAFGIVAAIVVVPSMNFVAMNWWVFRRAIGGPQPEPKSVNR